MERNFGEKFLVKGQWFQIVPGRNCLNCAFTFGDNGCANVGLCRNYGRSDRRDVVATKCKPPESKYQPTDEVAENEESPWYAKEDPDLAIENKINNGIYDALIVNRTVLSNSTPSDTRTVHVQKEYEILFEVLMQAFEQAQSGKGRERHAGARERFEDQEICRGARKCGLGAMAYQARKKSLESIRLYERFGADEALPDVLGAIIYNAAMAIVMQEPKPE